MLRIASLGIFGLLVMSTVITARYTVQSTLEAQLKNIDPSAELSKTTWFPLTPGIKHRVLSTSRFFRIEQRGGREQTLYFANFLDINSEMRNYLDIDPRLGDVQPIVVWRQRNPVRSPELFRIFLMKAPRSNTILQNLNDFSVPLHEIKNLRI